VVQRHIIIVDNDPAAALVTARGLQRLLKPSQVQITVTASAQNILQQGVSENGAIDLLIIDPNLQLQAASTLIEQLRKKYPLLPVLVLSAKDTPGVQKSMLALGVQNYLAKSIDLDKLAQTVSQLLDPVTNELSNVVPTA
jgi:DNA-binding NarL/FixJ family response regulator